MTDAEVERASQMLDAEFQQLVSDRDNLRANILRTTETNIHLPINLTRLMWNAKEKFSVRVSQKTDLTPQYVIDRVNEVSKNIKVYPDRRLSKSQLFHDANHDATILIKMYLRTLLNAKNMIQKPRTRLTTESFEWLLGEV